MTEQESYISSAMMNSVASFLIDKGLDPLQLASSNDIELDLNPETTPYLPADTYPRLMQAAINELGEEDLGFQLGKTARPERWGILGYILSTSSTLAEAMASLQKYQQLNGNIGQIKIEANGPYVLLAWDTKELPIAALAEEALAGWITFGRLVTGLPKSPRQVFFRHSAPKNTSQYEEFFEAPVHFDSDINGIEIPFTFLNVPLKEAEESDRDWLFDQADKKLNELNELPTYIVDIQSYISEHLPKRVPELSEVSDHFEINVRTLQRKLKKSGFTYKQLLDKTRMDLAKRLLQHSEYGIIDITFLLGFSEQSAFTRAFKRSTGQSPGEYRRSSLIM